MEILGYLLLTFLSSPRFYLDTVLLRASCFAVSLLLQLYGLGLITCSSSQLITELWIFFFLHLTSDQPSRKASACTVQHSTAQKDVDKHLWFERSSNSRYLCPIYQGLRRRPCSHVTGCSHVSSGIFDDAAPCSSPAYVSALMQHLSQALFRFLSVNFSNFVLCCFIQDVRKWLFWFRFFITRSYFRLHLQNTYQLKDQLKKFCEQ
jgi:hypothetical protein